MQVTNIYNLPQPLVDACTSDYKYKDKQFSVTTILKGTKEIILSKRHADEMTIDVSDMAWAIFGTAVHKVCEEGHATENQIQEGYLVVELKNGYKLSGRLDLYDEAEKCVTDYKTCSEWKEVFKDFKDWWRQLLYYAWMLEKLNFPCEHGKIVAFIKDWASAKAKVDSSYPQHPIAVHDFDFSNEDLELAESCINYKFDEIAMYEQLPDDEIPACTASERWYSGDKYAVKKTGCKRATKVFDNMEDAEQMILDYEKETGKHNLEIEFREGVNKKCEEYCNCSAFCNFFKKWKEEHQVNESEGI